MNPLTLSQIAQFAEASLSSGDGTGVINKVSTDSRTIKSGELFAALRGDNFDGHDFVEASAKAGATAALVDLNWAGDVPDDFVVLRANPLENISNVRQVHRVVKGGVIYDPEQLLKPLP